MRKFVSYIPFVLITIAAIVGLSFSESERRAMNCSGIEIEIDKGAYDYNFIVAEDVKYSIRKYIDSIQFLPVHSIEVFEIEQKLANHPSIRSCNVFVDVHGVLRIFIEQRSPII